MRIYHYTNIDALALILKNKTIRFNRLDQVDDLEEGTVQSNFIYLGKYIFVSCWTEAKEENIPLWKMYGGDFGGVRISLDRDMFKEYNPNEFDYQGGSCTGYLKTMIPEKDYLNPAYFVYPSIPDYNRDLFYKHIKYVDNPFKYKNSAVKKDLEGLHIDSNTFGKYKNKRWEFQEETRFVLNFFPKDIPIGDECNIYNLPSMQKIIDNEDLGFTFYDMHLKDDIFNTLEITLSPSATEGQRIIIETLINKFAPNAKIKESELGKVMRFK